jgi:hypothetical protein
MRTKTKIKTGKVEMPDEAFDDANAKVRISMFLPLLMVKDLKRLSLTPEHRGQYQVLMRDVLADWIAAQSAPKRKRA